MRIVFFVVCMVISYPAFAKNVVIFDNKEYQLAFINEGQSYSINEYIPGYQTIESWKNMITIHVYHNQIGTPPVKFAERLGARIKSENPQANYKILMSKDRKEAIIDFLTWPKTNKFLEFNIFKFRLHPKSNELMGLQFAIRHHGKITKDFIDNFKNNRFRWVNLIAKMKIPALKRKK